MRGAKCAAQSAQRCPTAEISMTAIRRSDGTDPLFCSCGAAIKKDYRHRCLPVAISCVSSRCWRSIKTLRRINRWRDSWQDSLASRVLATAGLVYGRGSCAGLRTRLYDADLRATSGRRRFPPGRGNSAADSKRGSSVDGLRWRGILTAGNFFSGRATALGNATPKPEVPQLAPGNGRQIVLFQNASMMQFVAGNDVGEGADGNFVLIRGATPLPRVAA